MSRLNSLNSSQPRHPTLSSSTFLDSRSIYLMAAEERNHRSSGMTGVSVFTELQIHSPRPHSSLSIVASPLIFLSPGFAVILSNIFTQSVPLSLSENRARHRPTSLHDIKKT